MVCSTRDSWVRRLKVVPTTFTVGLEIFISKVYSVVRPTLLVETKDESDLKVQVKVPWDFRMSKLLYIL